MRTITQQLSYWWDEELLDLLLAHGAKRFSRIDIWDVDWSAIAQNLGRDDPGAALEDPRSPAERLVMQWLRWTQRRNPGGKLTRWMQRALRPFGW